MSSLPLVILKTGTALPELIEREGDFEDWVRVGSGLASTEVQVVDPRACDDFPRPEMISGTIITGSPEMVTDGHDWVESSSKWIRDLTGQGVPILGICFGHQLLAHALGGTVGWNGAGREMGTVEITRIPPSGEDLLLKGIGETFPAHCAHAQTIEGLPPDAVVLARSDADSTQAFRSGDRVWGVQFHPEFTATVMHTYIEHYRQALIDQGSDPDALHRAVRPSPAGALLRRFAEWTLRGAPLPA